MITEKEYKVLKYLLDKEKDIGYSEVVHGLQLKPIIFSDEIIAKYTKARRHKIVIDTMTYTYLGKMSRKGYIRSHYKVTNNYACYVGNYITKLGREKVKEYEEQH